MKHLMPALLILSVVMLAACDAINPNTTTSISFSEANGADVAAGAIVNVNVANASVGIWRYVVRVNDTLVSSQVFSDGSTALPRSQTIPVIVPEAAGTHRISVSVSDANALEQRAEWQGRVREGHVGEGGPPLADPSAALQWFSPTLTDSVSGVVEVRFAVVANRAIDRVDAALVRDSDDAEQALAVAFDEGEYSASFNAANLAPGAYRIRLMAHLVTGDSFSSERSVSVASAAEDGIEWFSPGLEAQFAGVHTFSFALQSQREISSVRTFLIAPAVGSVNVVQSAMQPDALGRYVASVNTLAHAPGDYVLQVEVVYGDGSRRDFERSVVFVDPFMITSVSDGDVVGPGSPQGRVQVAITVGDVEGLLRGVRILGADVYLDNRLLGSLENLNVGDDNAFVSFAWDSAVTVAGVHDASVPGDRVVAVRVRYVVGEGDDEVAGARFTPPVLLQFVPGL